MPLHLKCDHIPIPNCSQVKWFKNGSPLSKEEGITSRRGNRHTLLLPGIRRRTFGDYECRASNKYGMDTSTTRVSGQNTIE